MRFRLVASSLLAATLIGCGSDGSGGEQASPMSTAGGGGAGGKAGQGGQGQAGAGGASGAGGQGGSSGQAGQAGQGGKAGAGGVGGSAGASGSAGSSSACPPPGNCGEVGTNGVCSGGMLRYCAPTPPGTCDPPMLVEKACGAGESCVVENGSAFCKATSACAQGEAFCGGADGNTLFSCKPDGSGFSQTPCDAGLCSAAVGEPATCLDTSNAGGVDHTLSGCITFEFRSMDKMGPSTSLDVNVAYYAHVGVYTGSKFIGKAITGPDGCFQAHLSEEPTPDTDVFIYPYDADPKTGKGRLAVLKNTVTPAKTGPYLSTEYWQWSNKTEGCGDGIKAAVVPDATGFGKHTIGDVDHNGDGKPDLLIPESCGSGAMQIYNWVRYAMRLLGDPVDGLPSTKGKDQISLGVIWSPSKDVFCGACYANRSYGGVTVTPVDGPPEKFDSVMLLSGSKTSPKHWSKAVLAHESGHWAMETYSKLPGESGPHDADKIYPPGLAYFEGWATAFGLDLISDQASGDFPLYIDTSQGNTFWVDVPNLNRGKLEEVHTLPLPSYDKPLDQQMNEYVVANMIWLLWQPKGPGMGYYGAVGADGIFKAFQSQRVVGSYNRGYATVDLVDLLDGVVCEKVTKPSTVQIITTADGFPYDPPKALCP